MSDEIDQRLKGIAAQEVCSCSTQICRHNLARKVLAYDKALNESRAKSADLMRGLNDAQAEVVKLAGLREKYDDKVVELDDVKRRNAALKDESERLNVEVATLTCRLDDAKEKVEGIVQRTTHERRRMPDERKSTCQKIKLTYPDADGKLKAVRVYVHVGYYEDGTVGEIFLKADRMGSTVSGLLDTISMGISVGLQAGVPLSWYVAKMKNMRFEPSGATNIVGIRTASSLMDALAKWLEIRFPKEAVE